MASGMIQLGDGPPFKQSAELTPDVSSAFFSNGGDELNTITIVSAKYRWVQIGKTVRLWVDFILNNTGDPGFKYFILAIPTDLPAPKKWSNLPQVEEIQYMGTGYTGDYDSPGYGIDGTDSFFLANEEVLVGGGWAMVFYNENGDTRVKSRAAGFVEYVTD